MMALLPARTFRGKLRILVIGSCLISSLSVAVVLIFAFYRELEQNVTGEYSSEAQILSMASEAPLRFKDPAAGLETLRTIDALPVAVGAWIYTPDDKLFAKYEPKNIPDVEPSRERTRIENGRYVVTHPVIQDNDMLGSLVVAYDMAPLRQRLRYMVALSAILAMLATLLAAALGYRLQKRLARPLSELSGTARQVANTGNYSLRAAKFEPDEFGEFTDRFNKMLGTIERQNHQLTVTNEELRQKNAEMEQFTYTVSHDLKNPIVTIKGFLGMLREDIAAGRQEDVEDSIAHITRAANRMTQLINELLELSRIGRVVHEPQRIDMTKMVRELKAEMSEQIANCGAEVVVEDMPPVTADATRVRQVFDNLLGNALKYGCAGEDRTVTVGGFVRGGEVRYFVRDRGPGIDPKYHQRIFGLFQRLDAGAEGTGIGLAIVSRIAETHGGRAWVESSPGNGATFWVLFPDDTGNRQHRGTGAGSPAHDALSAGRG